MISNNFSIKACVAKNFCISGKPQHANLIIGGFFIVAALAILIYLHLQQPLLNPPE